AFAVDLDDVAQPDQRRGRRDLARFAARAGRRRRRRGARTVERRGALDACGVACAHQRAVVWSTITGVPGSSVMPGVSTRTISVVRPSDMPASTATWKGWPSCRIQIWRCVGAVAAPLPAALPARRG